MARPSDAYWLAGTATGITSSSSASTSDNTTLYGAPTPTFHISHPSLDGSSQQQLEQGDDHLERHHQGDHQQREQHGSTNNDNVNYSTRSSPPPMCGNTSASYSPPVRRADASLPSSGIMGTSSSGSSGASAGESSNPHWSTLASTSTLPAPSTSSSTHHFQMSPMRFYSDTNGLSTTLPGRVAARTSHILSTSYALVAYTLDTLHPPPWRPSAHIVDQASAALLCYKLYALSITVPAGSKLFYYYLPSCTLSDLVAIALLQLGHRLAFGRAPQQQQLSKAATVADEGASGGSGRSAWNGKASLDEGNAASHLATVRSSKGRSSSTKRQQQSFGVRMLAYLTGANARSKPARQYTYSPLEDPEDDHFEQGTRPGLQGVGGGALAAPRTRTRRGSNDASNAQDEERAAFLGGGQRDADDEEHEEEKGDLFDDDEHFEHAHPPRPLSSSTAAATNGARGRGSSPYHSTSAPGPGSSSGSSLALGTTIPGPANPHYIITSSNTTATTPQMQTSAERRFLGLVIARNVFWIAFRFFIILASLVAIVFTVIAVGAYSAGRVVFSWQGAFDSTSQSGYLFGYALTEAKHFILTYLVVWSTGTFLTLSRYWVPQIASRTSLPKIGAKTAFAIVALAIMCLLAVCAAIRPPHALPATDLLIDGITASSALLFFDTAHSQPINLNRNATALYGHSNADQPRLTPLETDKIEHVFFIFLESADELAWPFSPEFCKHRNCADIPDEYNNVEHFTPFFNKLITQDPHALFVKDFRTNLAYTIKAHLASMCGVMPHIHDFMSGEADMHTPTACLPHIVRQMDSNFITGWFQAQMTAYDRQAEVIGKEGFQTVYDVNTMTRLFGHKKEWTNYFGYADEELHPLMWDWVDEQLNSSKRVFAATAGSTMHHDFSLPPGVPKVEYTKTTWSNSYLNVVKRTDRDLEIFFDNLKSRNLLDKSLIIIQGDHGPRIGEDGVYVDYGWWERIYRSPLVIRAPGLRPKQIEQDHTRPFIALDIMPTILDALGFSKNIIKSYVGQSIFRARGRHQHRDSYHAQSRGGQYPHHLRIGKKNEYKGIRWEGGDTCATDLLVDPTETYFYCVNEGWRTVFKEQELITGVDAGLWIEGSRGEKQLIEYAHEAKNLLDTHLAYNADFWDTAKHKEEYEAEMQNFLVTVHEQAHWD